MKKTASAKWQGGIKEGGGTLSTQTGVLKDAPYGFNARFKDGPGTNPEELIGAAHAGCFAMALSGQLEAAGLKADQLDVKAEVTLDKVEGGFAITAIHLTLTGKVPGADQARFESIANEVKGTCPVSKVLNANITLDTRLDA